MPLGIASSWFAFTLKAVLRLQLASMPSLRGPFGSSRLAQNLSGL